MKVGLVMLNPSLKKWARMNRMNVKELNSKALPIDIGSKFANMGFICACLVVLNHCGVLLGGVVKIAVPFFFVCSGYMLARHFGERGWYVREVRKRFSTLLIPYLSWCLIPIIVSAPFSICADLVAQRPFGTSIPLLHSPLENFGLCFGLPENMSLWYLRCLMILIILSPLLKVAVERFKWWWLLLVVVADCLVAKHYPACANRMVFFFPLESIFYFSLGGLWCMCVSMGRGYFWIRPNRKYACISFFCYWLIKLSSIQCVCAGYLSILTLLYTFWAFVPVKRFSSFCLKGSFLIYVGHMLMLSLIGIVMRRLSLPSLADSIIIWLSSILCLLCVNKVWDIISSKTLSFVTGGRACR